MAAPPVPACRRPAEPGPDAGATLLEMLVALSIMSVVAVMFTTGVLSVYRATHATEAIANTQGQLDLAFRRLDRQLRYASQLNEPGETANHWYVEFLTEPVGGTRTCTQLRAPKPVAPQQQGGLLIRSWALGATPPGFATLAPVIDPANTNPFTKLPPAQLRVRLASTATGAPGRSTTRHSEVSFTALNATDDTNAVATCEWRS